VAHLCLIHGADIGEEALVGNSSTVLDAPGSARAPWWPPAPSSLRDPDPDEMLAMGAPCKVKAARRHARRALVEVNPTAYQALAQRHRVGVHPV